MEKMYRETILHEYEVLLRAFGNGKDEYVGEFRLELADALILHSETKTMSDFSALIERVINEKDLQTLDKMYPYYMELQNDEIDFDEYSAITDELEW